MCIRDRLEDAAGINGILVGDSLGNVVLGYDTTIPVTVEDMIHHGAAVARGAKNSLVVVDMPFLSYQTSVYDAVVNAGKIMKETQCDCVKLEGGKLSLIHILFVKSGSVNWILRMRRYRKLYRIWDIHIFCFVERQKEKNLGRIKAFLNRLFMGIHPIQCVFLLTVLIKEIDVYKRQRWCRLRGT